MSAANWFRRSNCSLYQEACRRSGVRVASGPTPFQSNLCAAGKLDELFVHNYLLQEAGLSLPYASHHIVRELPTGRILRMRSFSPEIHLDAEGYLAVTKASLAVRHPYVVQPSATFDHGGRLHVVRQHVVGESFVQLVERLGPLKPDVAIELAIQLLKRLSELEGLRIIGIRPCQVILTVDQEISLVDLDETEALFFKRDLRLKASNSPVLTGQDRSFVAPEVTRDVDFDRQRAAVYAVGRNLSYLLTGQSRGAGTSMAQVGHSQDNVAALVDKLTDPDPSGRDGSYSLALRRLQLAIQSGAMSKHSIRHEPRLLDVSNRPEIRTLSILRVLVVASLISLISLSIGYFVLHGIPQNEMNAEERVGDEPASQSINSDEVFQVP